MMNITKKQKKDLMSELALVVSVALVIATVFVINLGGQN